ncbi:Crp/Fnr family transcriptional regulator [Paenibacillus sp. OAS669]|uniref:Crp/Fnr family transcriptional regulator n=1 Tax=Paenibacillus sp. OAS669 TaxID=2663821 RepID=UPI00178A9891|nr:Crp/Fnr family transcriptional regulator [Paenibacillus sp. OAS669]MBE1443101.1 CRP-like cAMP-binding protein [Paenibacillus sp. OAS669]
MASWNDSELTEQVKREGMKEEEEVLTGLFAQYGTARHYRKNELIFREDEESRDIYWVRCGLVKISQSAKEGQGITLFLRFEGEMFGAAEVLTGQRRQRFARCILDSEVLYVPADEFRSLMLSRPEIMYAVTVSNARRLLDTQRHTEMLISKPVPWRLAHFLLRLGERQGNELHVSLPLSHEEISFIVGCSRQTVTETLNRWNEQGIVHYGKKRIRIQEPDAFLTRV